jgi:hypothetical protein
MTAVGMFAGRGDVVIAMAFAVILGITIGYKIGKLVYKRKKVS